MDTNRPSLHAALESAGYTVLDLGIVPDKFISLYVLPPSL
jgi:molybdopterin biosynthesis enzyme